MDRTLIASDERLLEKFGLYMGYLKVYVFGKPLPAQPCWEN